MTFQKHVHYGYGGLGGPNERRYFYCSKVHGGAGGPVHRLSLFWIIAVPDSLDNHIVPLRS